MKKIKLLLLCCSILGMSAIAQTVTFKPNATIGQDALIATTYTCTPTNSPGPWETLNSGNSIEMQYGEWTLSSLGCTKGTTRGLIRFTDLNSLPSGITILHADLNLFGVSSSSSYGNSYYPGSPYTNTNPGWVQRITSGWGENTVTWNTQPGTTTTNQVAIPVTTSRWNWNTSIDVTALTQDILSSGSNDGFMLKLQTEAYHRMVIFASSDNTDSTLWPELVVSYCDPRFTYCVSSNNPYLYHFSAMAATGYQYEWFVDGTWVGGTQNLDYVFNPGDYEVCLKAVNEDYVGEYCERCIRLCIADNEVIEPYNPDEGKPAADNTPMPLQVTSFPAGDKDMLTMTSASPNPTEKAWEINLQTAEQGEAEISLYDIQGKKIVQYKKTLVPGTNSFLQSADKLTPGIYLMTIKKGGLSITEKLTKK